MRLLSSMSLVLSETQVRQQYRLHRCRIHVLIYSSLAGKNISSIPVECLTSHLILSFTCTNLSLWLQCETSFTPTTTFRLPIKASSDFSKGHRFQNQSSGLTSMWKINNLFKVPKNKRGPAKNDLHKWFACVWPAAVCLKRFQSQNQMHN